MRASLSARRRELPGMLLGWRLRRMHLMPLLCLSMKRFDTQDTELERNYFKVAVMINYQINITDIEYICNLFHRRVW